ncbi:MAG: inositol monophosphatase family protein [Bacteroidota bacterium]
MIPGKAREILETALKKGGEVLLKTFGNTLKTEVKESISSVVTEADLAADKAILQVLHHSPEQFNIITEESGFVAHKSRYTWVVDPLDGTSNFAAGGRMGAAVNRATKIWDIAAPWLIIREAGGLVTDVEGNEIVFDLSGRGFGQNYTILESGAGLHAQLLDILSPQ